MIECNQLAIRLSKWKSVAYASLVDVWLSRSCAFDSKASFILYLTLDSSKLVLWKLTLRASLQPLCNQDLLFL